MEKPFKLFMIMLGCRPLGRFTEQHDIFFGIGKSLKELLPAMYDFWPEANRQFHIDVWREVTAVDNYRIEILPKGTGKPSAEKLFFINLGGYRQNEFDEYHYKVLAVAPHLAEATKKAKATSFYKHCGFKGAVSHIDDKFGIDVDDSFNVMEILAPVFKEQFELKITPSGHLQEDILHIGYLKADKIVG